LALEEASESSEDQFFLKNFLQSKQKF